MKPDHLFHKRAARPHSNPSNDGQFGWKARDAAIVLERWFNDNGGPKVYTLALYTVFTDLACEKNSEEFIVGINELARRTGMSSRQVRLVLPIFAELGLIGWIETPGPTPLSQGPHRYKLLSLSSKCATHPLNTMQGAYTP
jgi:hypothetical protein